MSKTLLGKKAIVTGGSRGIGAAIAQRFAADGADVAILYAGNRIAAEQCVATIQAAGAQSYAMQADVAKADQLHTAIDAAAAKLGGLDVLVHSAGVAELKRIDEDGEATYRRHIAVNVDGVFIGTTAALPHLADEGRILIIDSVSAHAMPWQGGAIYGATKAAVAGLARGWARDLGPRGITVNVIQPGPIDTDMNPDDDRAAVALMKSLTAVGRYGRPEEIAALAAFLAGDEAAFITGTTIDIDGGLSI